MGEEVLSDGRSALGLTHACHLKTVGRSAFLVRLCLAADNFYNFIHRSDTEPSHRITLDDERG